MIRTQYRKTIGNSVAQKPPPQPQGWNWMHLGAGGLWSGFTIASDNSWAARADTYGAWIWSNNQWNQLVTSNSMPITQPDFNEGVYEVQFQYANSQNMYMVYQAQQNTGTTTYGVYKSTNKGNTWVLTSNTWTAQSDSFGATQYISPNDQKFRFWSQKLGVDPNNANNVIIGSQNGKAYFTTNAGAVWTAMAGIANSGNGNFSGASGTYPSPGHTGIVWHNTNSSIVYLSSNPGVYHSITGISGTFTQIANTTVGPQNVQFAIVLANGGYACISGNVTPQGINNFQTMWIYNGTSWAQTAILTDEGTMGFVAQDPFNNSHLIVTSNMGNICETTNGGTTWLWAGAANNYFNNNSNNYTFVCNDMPWLQSLGLQGTTAGYFDRTLPNVFYGVSDRDFYSCKFTTPLTNVTNTAAIIWTSKGIGQEQLNGNIVIRPPSSPGSPISLGCWDSAIFTKAANYVSFPQYANTFYPGVANVVACWNIDYASSNANYMMAICDGFYVSFGSAHAYSNNAGQSWIPLGNTATPNGTFSNTLFTPPTSVNGCLALSTPNNAVWVSGGGSTPFYTLNGPSNGTWTAGSFPQINTPLPIVSGTYVSASGQVTLTMQNPIAWIPANTSIVGQFGAQPNTLELTNLGGTGSFSNLQNYYWKILPGSNSTSIILDTSGNLNGNPAGTGSASGLGAITLNAGQVTLLFNSYSGSNINTSGVFTISKTICADRVLPNTFYHLIGNVGLYSSNNGGATWTQQAGVYPAGGGALAGFAWTVQANCKLLCAPGQAGHVWFGSGVSGNPGQQSVAAVQLAYSTNGGATWTQVSNAGSYTFGFGAPMPGGSGYPSIYMAGWVGANYGVWRSDNMASTWTQIGTFPLGSLEMIRNIDGDPYIWNRCYIAFTGSGFAYYNGPR